MAAQEASETFHWRYAGLDDKNFQIHGRSLLFLLIIFSVLVFLGLLCLYIRWACRGYHRWTTATATGDLSSEAGLPRPLGLDAETIGSFPVHLHRRSSSGDEAQCSICLSCLIDGEKVKVLPTCSHSFHPGCIDEWLKTHPSCPLCRASLGGSTAEPVAVV
ncbi:RING-H2 finger protein ATL66-like [Cocos nucifera]|uniref:RING-type E3 ubiquitin transferase n=1 Tax=Cocos nucifera TaxID=13894 RepID=A0A8K0I4X6_COCNU|nr:RING-H2 finger protein ATL66-like [Cocos nucifera]